LSDIDEALAALAARYRSRLPERLEALGHAVEAALADSASASEWFEATNLAHRLRGSAATHGLPELGAAAAVLEAALEAAGPGDAPGEDDGPAEARGATSTDAARDAVREALGRLRGLGDSP
jgi:HPt (histidine-containing phosphotransfer) domain-containing protein